MNANRRRIVQIGLIVCLTFIASPCRAADQSESQCIAILSNPDSTNIAKAQACQALALMGSGAGNAVGPLIAQLHDRNGVIRNEAITALAMIGAPASAALIDLRELAETDDSPGIRILAADAAAAINLELAFAIRNNPGSIKDAQSPSNTKPSAPVQPVNGFGGLGVTTDTTRPTPTPTPVRPAVPGVIPNPFGGAPATKPAPPPSAPAPGGLPPLHI